MKRYDVITIFPEVIAPYAEASILGKAQKKKLLKIEGHDLRKYSKDKHKKVDDTPYGGGAGMVMTVQPFEDAVQSIKLKPRLLRKKPTVRTILTSASGKRFSQADAKRLAEYDQVIFCVGGMRVLISVFKTPLLTKPCRLEIMSLRVVNYRHSS